MMVIAATNCYAINRLKKCSAGQNSQLLSLKLCTRSSQQDIATDFGSEDRGFDSYRVHHDIRDSRENVDLKEMQYKATMQKIKVAQEIIVKIFRQHLTI